VDAETKVSPDLQSAFFSIKGEEREGTLIHLLHDVIQMPLGLPAGVEAESENPSKKRKRAPDVSRGKGKPSEHSTIIFVSLLRASTEVLFNS
jgi:ATP-dependent RNA helicase DDX54/DBP10